MTSTIHAAAFNGDLLELENIYLQERDVNVRDAFGSTALHHGVFNGSIECVTFLLDKGAVLDPQDKEGNTPLQHASWRGHVECMKLLMDKGADVNTRDKNCSTPLHKAALYGNPVCVELLLSKGALVDFRTEEGTTALHHAALSGNVEVMEMLLASDADVEAVDNENATPLFKAAFTGHFECTKLLTAKQANKKHRDANNGTLLHAVANSGSLECLNFILQNVSGQVELDVNAVDSAGVTPLHLFSFFGHVECAKRLVALGAAIDAVDSTQCTPLHKACFTGARECALLLLDNNARVDSKDDEGAYALHKVAFNGHVDLVRLLLDRGADMDARDGDGCTPLHKAAFRGHTTVVGLLALKGASVNARDRSNGTPLHNACCKGYAECAKLMLESSAEVNALDVNNCTPLHFASGVGSGACVELLTQPAWGADPNLKDNKGKTPLAYAVERNRDMCVHILIQRGGNLALVEKRHNLHLSGAVDAGDDVAQYNDQKGKLTPFEFNTAEESDIFKAGVMLFNQAPEKGIDFLAKEKILARDDHREIARFLHMADNLSKVMIGEHLGERKPIHIKILGAFVGLMDFSSLDFDIALRRFLTKFRLPGEAQKIDRIMQKFAQAYYRDNPTNVFANADACFVLAFSTIMLNTDAHNPAIRGKAKMTKDQFLRNNRGINNGEDLPLTLLEGLYDRIIKEEIKMDMKSDKMANAERKGWVTFRPKKKALKIWKRRWFVLCDNTLFYFKKPGDSEQQGELTLESMMMSKLVKGKRSMIKLEAGDDVTGDASLSSGADVYYLFADNDEDTNTWFSQVKSHMTRFKLVNQ
eukprot:TRINITY_DN2456_c0_g1_i3.p1 TRINITY_DN2456_c0_g1~~TRINITY_DN2456_c0_g1_i3.p1  ORF type:complete len:816 (+),score=216.67 TRINITY_DN2456_c0_g1_i3:397-2844(+)